MHTLLRGSIYFSLVVALCLSLTSCDLFGSGSDDPAYVGAWVSETVGYGDDTVYLDITSDNVTMYEIGTTATGSPSCLETSASIASYDGESNTLALNVEGEQVDATVEAQNSQLTYGISQQVTYESTDVNPQDEADASCIQANEVNSSPTFPYNPDP